MTDDRHTPTTNAPTRNRPRTATPTLADLDHAGPLAGSATNARMFGRGPEVATDGGRQQPRAGEAAGSNRTLGDLDHSPPDEDGAADVWTRGLALPARPVVAPPDRR